MKTRIIHPRIQNLIRDKIKDARKNNIMYRNKNRQQNFANMSRRNMHTHSPSNFPSSYAGTPPPNPPNPPNPPLPPIPPNPPKRNNDEQEIYAFLAGMVTSCFCMVIGKELHDYIH